jgi:hypothetical protein
VALPPRQDLHGSERIRPLACNRLSETDPVSA